MPLLTRIVLAISVGCLAIWAIISLPVSQDESNDIQLSAEMRAALDEANRSFTFNGKPIHPLLVKEFSIWLSDNTSPVTVSVDVVSAAKARNEYYSDAVVDGSSVRANNPEMLGYSGWTGFYQYERLGTLKNGLQVLRVSDCGGGSGIFEDLFFVKFTTDSAYDENGESYERLLMTVVREYTLGDRDDGSIEVNADEVIISASKYRSDPIVLKF
jgi:hypothetical protein